MEKRTKPDFAKAAEYGVGLAKALLREFDSPDDFDIVRYIYLHHSLYTPSSVGMITQILKDIRRKTKTIHRCPETFPKCVVAIINSTLAGAWESGVQPTWLLNQFIFGHLSHDSPLKVETLTALSLLEDRFPDSHHHWALLLKAILSECDMIDIQKVRIGLQDHQHFLKTKN